MLIGMGLAIGASRRAHADEVVAQPPLSGSWLDSNCAESAEFLAYTRMVLRFGSRRVAVSFRYYSDPDCKVPNSERGEDTVMPYIVPQSYQSTDGSIAIDSSLAFHGGGGTTIYCLFKRENGLLYVRLFMKPEDRPTSMDLSRATVFSPL